MTTNIYEPSTERQRKYCYEITIEYGNKVGNPWDIYGYYKEFEVNIDQTTSDVTIKNDYYGNKQKYKKDALRFHPHKNLDGDHILFFNAKYELDIIQQAYDILGDTNEEGRH